MKILRSLILFVFIGILASPCTFGQAQAGKQVSIQRPYPSSDIDGYLLYLPKSYDTHQNNYPLLIFLQGSLGVGGEIDSVANWGIPKILRETQKISSQRDQYLLDSFIVVCPHIRTGEYYKEEPAMRKMIEELQENYRIDPAQISLMGLSRGGMGSWGLAETMSDIFAAVVPIAGGVWMVTDYTPMIDLPIWIGHATEDPSLDFPPIEEAAKKIEALGGDKFFRMNTAIPFTDEYLSHTHIFSAFERDIHNVWGDMYASVQLYKWLLKQKKHE